MQKLFSASISGIQGQLIEIEVDVVPGMGQFCIVGLGDTAIQESRERVRSALKNSGYKFPSGARITVNMAPADLRKKGPHYDFPIALGILSKDFEFDEALLKKSIFVGELALDGNLRGIQGILPIAILAKELSFERIFIPYQNAQEAKIIPGIEIHPIKTLGEMIDILVRGAKLPVSGDIPMIQSEKESIGELFEHIHGQEHAKRALLIAAAGGHNILLEGPPGSGKTMLAKALRNILPPMNLSEQIELSKIYSVAGLLTKEYPLVQNRPFRTIHHTASEASIIGGGRDSRPGEISLAHRGVLFLDEFLEFPKTLIETLRQPLEDGEITIHRVHQVAKYPARFSLVGAMNPCPCGYLGEIEKTCTCSPGSIERYRGRLSGPILDRIDLFIKVPRVRIGELGEKLSGMTSKELKQKVENVRNIQSLRFISKGYSTNAEMTNKDIEICGNISPNARQIAIVSTEKLKLSTRVYYRILRVARTIADIDSSPNVEVRHILEALSYRGSG